MRLLRATRCTLEPLGEAHAAEMFGVLSDPAILGFEIGSAAQQTQHRHEPDELVMVRQAGTGPAA